MYVYWCHGSLSKLGHCIQACTSLYLPQRHPICSILRWKPGRRISSKTWHALAAVATVGISSCNCRSKLFLPFRSFQPRRTHRLWGICRPLLYDMSGTPPFFQFQSSVKPRNKDKQSSKWLKVDHMFTNSACWKPGRRIFLILVNVSNNNLNRANFRNAVHQWNDRRSKTCAWKQAPRLS